MFCFLGLPGSGKGVQSILFRERLGISHIAPGVLLRMLAKTDAQIAEQLATGDFIDDQLVADIISKAIKNRDSSLFIIDGYPRNVHQAVTLQDTLKSACNGETSNNLLQDIMIKKIFFLDCPEDLVIQRLLNRQVCPNCNRSFDMESIICQYCQCNLEKRSDDELSAITIRISNAKCAFPQIFSIFQDKVVIINGNQPIQDVYADILKHIREFSQQEINNFPS